MREVELERAVADLCKLYNLQRFHHRDSRGTEPGWPDDVIIGPNGVIFRELKTDTGRATPAQLHTITMLCRCGLDARIWRPTQLRDGTISRELLNISGRK